MSATSVFISSTYKDLKLHRREVWDALKHFEVSVRGMEEFGARTAGALETCLAEVEQCDVYVGIIAYRLGSVESNSQKSFTMLEYEKAIELKKEILIYIADDEAATFPKSSMEEEQRPRERLSVFKSTLRERHTVDTFSTPQDLAEKLSRDFKKRFQPKELPKDPLAQEQDAFEKSARLLREFRLTPKKYNGMEVKLRVKFLFKMFPASRSLCEQFNLEYGLTVGSQMRVERPTERDTVAGFTEIYASGPKIDAFRKLHQSGEGELYAKLQFTGVDVKRTHAEFMGYTYFVNEDEPDYNDSREIYVPPEGKVILLFTKAA